MGEARNRAKRDRTARLTYIEHLLYQNTNGLTLAELARHCDVSTRTTRRDLEALETELKVPLWQNDSRFGIAESYFLPPVHFSVPEALNIFLAVRLMLRYSNRYDPTTASTFTRLNSIVPSPLREQIQKTLEWMRSLKKDEKYLRCLAALAEAWVRRHRVRITYQALYEDEPKVRTIEPYFIEPAAPGHSSYIIAYCHLAKEMRTFKIERIKEVWQTGESYEIPPDFDASAYLGSSWGIMVGGEVKDIKLKFSPEIARIMEETVYHPSQSLEPHSDGTVIMTLQVNESEELIAWVMGWGEKVEVLSPASLRKTIARTAREMLKIYKKR